LLPSQDSGWEWGGLWRKLTATERAMPDENEREKFETMREALTREILRARERVYAIGAPTPLECLELADAGRSLWVKREDLGPIKSYKWRGAYNAMASLGAGERDRGIVAASAGNHAQGVALASRALGCRATIFMPRATPAVKQREVRKHGGETVEVRLVGDTYDEASAAAREFEAETDAVFIHPYDDLAVMGGQGTLADEIIMSGKGPFDRVYVAVGGGGMAAAVACWLKNYWPDLKVIGVEGVGQASMSAAVEAGKPVELAYVDVFCDGTAVRKVGEHTRLLCHGLLDGLMTVTNDEVCEAIRVLWEANRSVPEPSGAMGLAGFLQDHEAGRIKDEQEILTIVCGANMDFAQLGRIAGRAGIGPSETVALRAAIPEGRGTFVRFLERLPRELSIIDLQYGRTPSATQHPIVSLGLTPAQRDTLLSDLRAEGIEVVDVSKDEDVLYRVIPYDPELLHDPVFVTVEFSERAGALREFMREIAAVASLCYFNYQYSGERVGRALIGIDFDNPADKEACRELMKRIEGHGVRSVREVTDQVLHRLKVQG